ncbi:Clavaminate synthase-like protein [Trichoderma chlorosporum]
MSPLTFPEPIKQIQIGHGPDGYQDSLTAEADGALYRREHEKLTAKLMRLCPPSLWPLGSHMTSCPRPILINEHHQSMLQELSDALVASVTDIVNRWWFDTAAEFPKRMPLGEKEQQLLKYVDLQSRIGNLPHYAACRGSWRPDFMVEELQTEDGITVENFRITEINARFSFNGFMHTAYGQIALEEAGVGRQGLASATNPKKIVDGLLTLFRRDRPFHLLKGEEAGMDIHMFVDAARRRLGIAPRIVDLADLRLVSDAGSKSGYMICAVIREPQQVSDMSSMFFTSEGELVEQIYQVGLELHQRELLAMRPEMLREISLRCFNDMRTILLVHDKRMLGIIKQELPRQVARGVITERQAMILNRGVADTLLPGSLELRSLMIYSEEHPEARNDYLLKPIRSGKGDGIRFGDDLTSQEWMDALKRQLSPALGLEGSCVIQRRIIPRLCSQEPGHVRSVSEKLRQRGILKVSLGFADNKSRYLEQLLVSLHRNHGHQLPIAHSATRGWFWDVLPSSTNFQTANCQARSETMEDFPWHTDCSYEDPPPRYFALQVLQPDRCGGGTLSVMNVERLSQLLSPAARESLAKPEFLIRTPPEFIKDPGHQHIVGSILLPDDEGRLSTMRFREDLLTPLSERAAAALEELKQALQGAEAKYRSTLHLTPKILPERSIILMDNRRWLHARNHVRDPERHLRRVRWDAVPFPRVSA